MGRPRSNSSASNFSSPAPRVERKIIEKNRRNRMKILFSNLVSLLPNYISREVSCISDLRAGVAMHVEGLPLPDQIGEVVEYIESLKLKLEKLKQKKETLLPRKRHQPSYITKEDQVPKSKSQFVEVHDMGPNMDVILANGIEDYSEFQRIISFLQGNGFEIASANFSFGGNSSIQVLQNKVEKSNLGSGFGSSTIVERLKDLVFGSSSSSTEVADSQLNVWDYEFESNIWSFGVPEV